MQPTAVNPIPLGGRCGLHVAPPSVVPITLGPTASQVVAVTQAMLDRATALGGVG
jgi:hypothetical protein